jgi:soluble lytic murein transglycosylase-like protein
MILVVSCAVHAASMDVPPRRVTSVVRADARSGRLVRSVVVAPVAVAPKVVAPVAVPAATDGQPQDAKIPEMVERIAAWHQVEPKLVDSVIRVESNYDPYAMSNKGAQGLMQLMPSTARQLGVTRPFNPSQNIEGGVRYLKYLLDLYGGDQRLALAAYNAGPGAVSKYKDIPPYPETLNYVYQVGKRLGTARANEKTKPAKPAAKPDTPVIERLVDPEGREYYRTR